MSNIYIGTSGWQYSNWRGSFYPENLPQKDWLRYYANYFDTVEVNSSFYRQTRASTFEKWQNETPPGFVFAVKGNRFITHIKRLKDCEEPLKIFFENLSVLEGHATNTARGPVAGFLPASARSKVVFQTKSLRAVGSPSTRTTPRHVILWQLPPSLKQDIKRLEIFLKLLPTNPRHAFEFRNETWVNEKTWEVLKKYNSAAVFQDWPEWPQIREATADFVYIRFHGNKVLYTSDYTDEELKEWAVKIKNWLGEGKDVYAYFNNDAAGHAVHNALKLKELVEL